MVIRKAVRPASVPNRIGSRARVRTAAAHVHNAAPSIQVNGTNPATPSSAAVCRNGLWAGTRR